MGSNLLTGQRVVLAMDSFKSCLSSKEAGECLEVIFRGLGAQTSCLQLSDGGEGMLEAFASPLGARIQEVHVHDPLMREITAKIGIAGQKALIETAQACGLTLMSADERNPLLASTYGVGEMLIEARKMGCVEFIVGLGGSGTSDAGKGMLEACSGDTRLFNGCHFTLACDVRNPLYGPNGAASVFGPQKGATEQMVEELDRRARAFAERSAILCGKDLSMEAGAGAAGGLGYAFMQFFNARIVPGAELLFDLIDFNTLVRGADIVITGEGKSDRSTLMGKLPQRVLSRSKAVSHAEVWLVSGAVSDMESLLDAGFDKVSAITPNEMPLETATKPEIARNNLRIWADSL